MTEVLLKSTITMILILIWQAEFLTSRYRIFHTLCLAASHSCISEYSLKKPKLLTVAGVKEQELLRRCCMSLDRGLGSKQLPAILLH